MSQRAFYRLTFLLSAAGYAYLALHFSTWKLSEKANFCLIKTATGLPCPSCGSTRSLISILEGQVEASVFIWNPIGWLIFIMLALVPAWATWDVFRKKNSLWLTYTGIERFLRQKWVYLPLILLVLLNWYWTYQKGL
jgi:hypothetical protein